MPLVKWIYDTSPTNESIRGFLELANQEKPPFLLERSYDFDNYKAANMVVRKLKKNDIYANVFAKVHLINSIYSTRMLNVNQVAVQLYVRCAELDFDARIVSGDASLVDGLKTITLVSSEQESKKYKFLSFASKYCHCHKPNRYPIYDRYVWFGLKEYAKIHGITHYKNRMLEFGSTPSSYERYKEVVDAVITWIHRRSKSKKLSYGELDRFLWIIGRAYHAEVNCSANHRTTNDKPAKIQLKASRTFTMYKQVYRFTCSRCGIVNQAPLTNTIRFLRPFA